MALASGSWGLHRGWATGHREKVWASAERCAGCPSSERLLAQRVYHHHGVGSTFGGSLTAVDLPLELTPSVRVGVDSQAAAGVDRLAQEPSWWVESLRTRVHLDRDVVFAAC